MCVFLPASTRRRKFKFIRFFSNFKRCYGILHTTTRVCDWTASVNPPSWFICMILNNPFRLLKARIHSVRPQCTIFLAKTYVLCRNKNFHAEQQNGPPVTELILNLIAPFSISIPCLVYNSVMLSH